MKRITKAMIEAGGWRYCCMCNGPRVKAHWTHAGREYCDVHKPEDADVPASCVREIRNAPKHRKGSTPC